MEDAPEAEAPKAEEEKAAAPMEASEVVYWSLTSAWGSFNEEIGAELVAEFNETFEAYNVTTVPKSGRDNRDTLPAAVAGGAAPDMAFQDRYIPKTMAVNGVVRDITDMVKASSIINTSDMWERILNDVTYRGTISACRGRRTCAPCSSTTTRCSKLGSTRKARPPRGMISMMPSIRPSRKRAAALPVSATCRYGAAAALWPAG